jgi:hypothetical protein
VNYSENKKVPFTFFEPQDRIVSAVFVPTKPIQGSKTSEPILIIAQENKTLHFLHGKSLLTYKNITPSPIPVDCLNISEDVVIKSTSVDPFQNQYIVSILLKNENVFFIGYDNGFVQEYDTRSEKTLKVFNPISFQLNDNPEFPLYNRRDSQAAGVGQTPLKVAVGEANIQNGNNPNKPVKEESKIEEEEEEPSFKEKPTRTLESFLLPGVHSLNHCKLYNSLIVNHLPSFTDSNGVKYDFVETLIYLYSDEGGAPMKRLKGCKGSIAYSKILQER